MLRLFFGDGGGAGAPLTSSELPLELSTAACFFRLLPAAVETAILRISLGSGTRSVLLHAVDLSAGRRTGQAEAGSEDRGAREGAM